MTTPVVVQFQVGGVADVMKALSSIESALQKAEQNGVKGAERASRSRVSSAEKEAKDKQRLLDKTGKDEERAYKDAVRYLDNSEREKTRTLEREEQTRTRVSESAERTRTRDAAREEQSRTRTAESEGRRRQEVARRFATTITGAASRGVSGAGGLLTRGATSLAQTALSLGGGFSIADALGTRAREMGQAADIANAGHIEGDAKNGIRRSSADIHSQAMAVGHQFGMATGDVQTGLSKFVDKTGDLTMGLSTMQKLAELSTATGASFEDLAGSAAAVFNSDTTQNAEDLLITIRSLAAQGKLGAMDIKDLASQTAKLTASAGKFEGNKEENVLVMGAFAQQAMLTGGAPFARNATTSVATLGQELAKNADKFRKDYHIEVMHGTKLRAPEQIFEETIQKTHGNVSSIAKLFGLVSGKSIEGYASIYRDKGGGVGDKDADKTAMQAVRDQIDVFKKAKLSEQEVAEAAAIRMQETDKKWDVAVLKMKDIVTDKLMPKMGILADKVEELIPKFESLVDHVSQVIDWFAKNPFEGIGRLVSFFIMKEMAAAMIKDTFAKGIETAMGTAVSRMSGGGAVASAGGFMGGGGAGAGAGALGALSATFAITVAALTILATGTTIIDAAHVASEENQKEVIGTQINAQNVVSNLRAKAANGTLTQDDISDATGKLRALQFKENEERSSIEHMLNTEAAIMNFPGGKERFEQDNQSIQRLVDGGIELTKALVVATGALAGSKGGPEPIQSERPPAEPNQSVLPPGYGQDGPMSRDPTGAQ